MEPQSHQESINELLAQFEEKIHQQEQEHTSELEERERQHAEQIEELERQLAEARRINQELEERIRILEGELKDKPPQPDEAAESKLRSSTEMDEKVERAQMAAENARHFSEIAVDAAQRAQSAAEVAEKEAGDVKEARDGAPPSKKEEEEEAKNEKEEASHEQPREEKDAPQTEEKAKDDEAADQPVSEKKEDVEEHAEGEKEVKAEEQKNHSKAKEDPAERSWTDSVSSDFKEHPEKKERYDQLIEEYGECKCGTNLFELWMRLGGTKGWKDKVSGEDVSLMLCKNFTRHLTVRMENTHIRNVRSLTVPSDEIKEFVSVMVARLPLLLSFRLVDVDVVPFDFELLRSIENGSFRILNEIFISYTPIPVGDILEFIGLVQTLSNRSFFVSEKYIKFDDQVKDADQLSTVSSGKLWIW